MSIEAEDREFNISEKDLLRLILRELLLMNERIEAAFETTITEDDIKNDFK